MEAAMKMTSLESQTKVLVVDDEEDLRILLEEILADADLDVRTVGHPNDIPDLLKSFQPDIVILDQIMPEKHGVEVLRDIRASREFKTLPVLILSGQTGEDDKVRALSSGADDYLTKPFGAGELIARVRALLRRADMSSISSRNNDLDFDGLKFNLLNGSATLNGERLLLTTTEFRLLVELVSNPERVLSREHLIATAMGGDNVTDRTVDVHMASLRKKLDQKAKHIKTVRGVGYQFVTQV